MSEPNLEQVYEDLLKWCRDHDFAGYDPFDALNSRVLQATPLKHSRTVRLISTQLIKRAPVNLRPLFLVSPQKNPKGTALFTLAAISSHRRLKTVETEKSARHLLGQLLDLQIPGYHGAAWGYNFDWQSRKFFAPAGTPTIVPTAFAARALIEGYQVFGDKKYLNTARTTCDFILHDLKRSENAGEVCFSYSPLDETKIFNASLLAAETLAVVGRLTGEKDFCDLAARAGRYVVSRQRDDGSWAYGSEAGQSWTDNFHTAYVLVSLFRIMESCGDVQQKFSESLRRGYDFWRERFFLADGWPKYYDDSLYPADSHAAATAIVALVELQKLDADALILAKKVAAWAIQYLHADQGYFYYQRRRLYTVRTPYMRWTQAWMLYALARLLKAESVGVFE
jgi:hypothetical protein